MTGINPGLQKDIQQAASFFKEANSVISLTGAGISTPSGIPDFRSEGSGLWRRYSPWDVASLTAFRHNPKRFFDWLRPFATQILSAHPNPAHVALSQLEEAGYMNVVITQNIDGLHHKAGSKNVLEVHGSFKTLTCIGCFNQYSSVEYFEPYIQSGQIPYCSDCNKILKPDVILIEEQLPIRTWLKAEDASRRCDLILVAGTSLEVTPVAMLPMYAVENNASLIVVNKTATYIDERADIIIKGDVAEILPRLASEVIRE
jgi:NAD-dependent deacetylase